MNPDELDKKIVVELLRDARLSFRELAKKVDCSVVTAAQRVRKLEKERVLKGFRPHTILEDRQARAVSRRGLLASRARP